MTNTDFEEELIELEEMLETETGEDHRAFLEAEIASTRKVAELLRRVEKGRDLRR